MHQNYSTYSDKHNGSIRFTLGAKIKFLKKSQEDFFSKEYKVTKLTDRMGMRLEGEKLENIISKNIRSEGITKGSIQTPGDGQPIILLSDHPTIGGYPKIANVITADYDKLVQIPSGSQIKFQEIELTDAEILADRQEALGKGPLYAAKDIADTIMFALSTRWRSNISTIEISGTEQSPGGVPVYTVKDPILS